MDDGSVHDSFAPIRRRPLGSRSPNGANLAVPAGAPAGAAASHPYYQSHPRPQPQPLQHQQPHQQPQWDQQWDLQQHHDPGWHHPQVPRPALRPCRSATQLRPNDIHSAHHPLKQQQQQQQYQQYQQYQQQPYQQHLKPPNPRGYVEHDGVDFVIDDHDNDDDLPPPYAPFAPTPHSGGELRRVQSSSALSIAAPPPPPPPPTPSLAASPSALSASSSAPASSSSTSKAPSSSSKWKAALDEAQYFAGGLLSRPAESTRHFTIIRHSHALVWYRGPSTSVSMTVLADAPLPAGRTVWLQEKGYSGGVGMSVKALLLRGGGSTAGWLDVTPAREARPEHIPAVDERGIQRDLRRFAKRAAGSSRLRDHVPRETHVVRIPATAADGYFRLVLCEGGGSGGGSGEEEQEHDGNQDDPKKKEKKNKEKKKKGKSRFKVLCGSPVFRIASTSTDVAVVRGASIRTMPLEVGVKVASTIGQQVAKKYAGVAGAVVQGRAAKVAHFAAAKTAGKAVARGYYSVGLADAVNDSWHRSRQAQQQQHEQYDRNVLLDPTAAVPVAVIGSDEGPAAPFPLAFDGRVVAGSGRSAAELGYPTANLKEVPDGIKTRMGGVFAAWAMVVLPKTVAAAPGRRQREDGAVDGDADADGDGDTDMDTDWHEAVVTIAPPRDAPPSVAMRNRVAVHIAFDFDGATFCGARLKVLLMGYLHPAAPPTPWSSISTPTLTPSDDKAPNQYHQHHQQQHQQQEHQMQQQQQQQQQQQLADEHAQDVMTTLASLGRDNWRRPDETVAQMRALRGERSFSDRLTEATGRVQERVVDRIPLHWAGVRSESGTLRDQMYGTGGIWVPRG
ncbi:hypothetical protein O9K51_02150 [Purpureocillium lavendulum]|uniref:Riboflavin kinase n=1 Tax=Purpureocillium lavendulum TaxID=1247861 RepID=A0AB34FXX5_9HYPO|nr:hypothetical protein O9K51_02150 [Purpureocillium lavendulum]